MIGEIRELLALYLENFSELVKDCSKGTKAPGCWLFKNLICGVAVSGWPKFKKRCFKRRKWIWRQRAHGSLLRLTSGCDSKGIHRTG
jgi:hypothetical protein